MNRRTIRKLAAGSFVAVATTTITVVAPGVAQAAPFKCQSGQLCFYSETYYRGTVSLQPRLTPGNPRYTGSIADFRNSHYSNGDSLNDSVSSVVNYTPFTVELYIDGHWQNPRGTSLGSYPYDVGPGQAQSLNESSQTSQNGPVDNLITSVRLT